jgi:hypothetical protein
MYHRLLTCYSNTDNTRTGTVGHPTRMRTAKSKRQTYKDRVQKFQYRLTARIAPRKKMTEHDWVSAEHVNAMQRDPDDQRITYTRDIHITNFIYST